MSTFNESLHPRGQVGNAGQFVAKANDAPTGTLTSDQKYNALGSAHQRVEWAARIEGLQWERRVRHASLEQFMALAAVHAPAGATHAIFQEEGDDMHLLGWQNLGGDQLDEEPFDGHQLLGFADNDHLRDAGFERDEESWTWTIELRDPVEPRQEMKDGADRWASDAHYVDDRAGGDGALGSFLSGVTRRAPDVGAALGSLSEQQVASLNRDFEAFASLMAGKIRTMQES